MALDIISHPNCKHISIFCKRTSRQKNVKELASQRTGTLQNMTRQSIDRRRRAACNTGLAKVAVQCSADTFVVNQSLVLRINICGENRHLRQARKR
jgi:hypothetical protein